MQYAIYRLALVALSAGSALASVAVTGKVADENGIAIPSARVEFRLATEVAASAVSDLSGAFSIRLPSAGEYQVQATRPGFFVFNGKLSFGDGPNHFTLTLNHLEDFIQSVDVAYSPPAIDTEQTAEQKQLHSAEILAIPYPASQDLRNALPLIHGVVQDNGGRLHFNGGDTGQTNFTLDGFNIADPVTGRFEARLNVESVRSVEVEGARFSAARDRGSAGTVDIQTGMGDDRWRFGLTNFFPSFSTQSSFHFNKWTPRISVSGPLARGRAWFYNGFDAFYDVDTVPELADGQNRTRALSTSNLTRLQVNLTPGNILTGSMLVNYAGENRDGLSFLSPVETTLNRRQNLYFYSLKDQIFFPNGALIEFGFALNRGYARDRPQGHETLDISPFGRSGNYFLDLTRHSGREQWSVHSTLPSFQAFGAHQVRFGADAQNSSFTNFASRHDYRILREDLTVARYVTFQGDGSSQKSGFRLGEYVQDRWAPAAGILIESGLRVDWDSIIDTAVLSPRLSIAYAPRWAADTKLAAGIGIFHDAPSLGIFGRQDQVSLMTFYDELGRVRLEPLETAFDVENADLAAPRYRILSFSLERKLPLSIYGKASYMGKLGRRNFTFVPEPGDTQHTPFQGGLYRLRNWRNDRYDSFELTFRRTFGRFEWSGGYTRSSARSDAVVDYSLENPIFADQAPGPLPWDTPHRFMTWGWAPLPGRLLPRALSFLTRDTDVAYLAEYRTGFPFGVVNEDGFLVGKPNERRLPAYFSVNLHFERRFRFLRYQWAWRFGLNNLTNRGNPNIVNNNIDSSAFLAYGCGQQRAFNVRLRFLGRR